MQNVQALYFASASMAVSTSLVTFMCKLPGYAARLLDFGSSWKSSLSLGNDAFWLRMGLQLKGTVPAGFVCVLVPCETPGMIPSRSCRKTRQAMTFCRALLGIVNIALENRCKFGCNN